MKDILNFLTDNWEAGIGVGTLAYEIAARRLQTKKNWSLIDLAFKVVSFVIKNRRKPDPTDTIDVTNPNKNRVWVDRGKHILTVVFLIASLSSFAQTNLTGKSVRFFNADSLTVQTEVSGLQLMYDNVGALYYNKQQSKFRIFYDSAWHDLIQSGGGGGGGTVTSGTNGIMNFDAATLGLGGALTTDTEIEAGGNYDFTLREIKNFSVTQTTGDVQMSANSGEMRLQAGLIDIHGNADLTINTGDVGAQDYSGLIIGETELTLGTINNLPGPLKYATLNTVEDGVMTIQATDSITITSSGTYVKIDAPDSVVVNTGTGPLSLNLSELQINNNPGTSGQFLKSNGPGAAPTWATGGGGGITNTSAINEIPRTTDVAGNLVSSQVEVSTLGDINLGLSTVADTEHFVRANSSTASAGVRLAGKGTSGNIILYPNESNTANNLSLFGSGLYSFASDNAGATSAYFTVSNTNYNNTIILGAESNNAFIHGGNLTGTPGTFTIRSQGNNSANDGDAILIKPGKGGDSGGDGGNLTLESGNNGTSGNDGNITLNVGSNGELIFVITRTSCSGAPSGAVYNNAGVLSICP